MRGRRVADHLVALALFVSAALGCESRKAARPQPPPRTAAASAAAAATPSTGEIKPASGPDACRQLPFLNVYRRAGALKEQSLSRVRLELHVDLHMLDCIAPDGYGHDMDVALELRSLSGRCEIASVSSRSTPFGDSPSEKPVKPWGDTFQPTENVNLAEPSLEKVEFRDPATKHALVLLRYQYFFYEDVVPGAPLKPELAGEDAKGCCYGAIAAAAQHWYFEYFRSPFWDRSTGELDADELAAFNRFATESELREDLHGLVERGFETTTHAAIDIALSQGEPPRNAAVTVKDRWNDDWERQDLRDKGPHQRTLKLSFSRKACAACETKMTPWWLYSATATTHCRTAGGLVESNMPCP